jgi:hypothetical protein
MRAVLAWMLAMIPDGSIALRAHGRRKRPFRVDSAEKLRPGAVSFTDKTADGPRLDDIEVNYDSLVGLTRGVSQATVNERKKASLDGKAFSGVMKIRSGFPSGRRVYPTLVPAKAGTQS